MLVYDGYYYFQMIPNHLNSFKNISPRGSGYTEVIFSSALEGSSKFFRFIQK